MSDKKTEYRSFHELKIIVVGIGIEEKNYRSK